MASFSSEIIGRNVVDVEGAMFGVVTDLRLAPTTGTITHVLVEHAPEIDRNACRGARETVWSRSQRKRLSASRTSSICAAER